MYSTKVQYLVIYCMPNTWPSPYRVPRPTLFIDDSTSTCVYFINISDFSFCRWSQKNMCRRVCACSRAGINSILSIQAAAAEAPTLNPTSSSRSQHSRLATALSSRGTAVDCMRLRFCITQVRMAKNGQES